ncbi:MAG: hypothetical protein JJE05_03080 [Actinobacteria bacterium]|nr:hypothetical protein [Actinomycetota bacterium]
MSKRTVSIFASLAVAGLLLPMPSSAHSSLRKGRYECWLSEITQYSNYDLKIKAGNKYAFTLDDETVGKAGKFVHDGKKLRFTSGYLKEEGYKGKHAALDDTYNTHMVYLYKNGDLKYDCNNN